MDLNKGGRGAIERMVEAYGFTTRQALCDQLNVSKSTLATRYMRDSFPSDWVIQCALETGASLRWLTTGEGAMYENAKQLDIVQIPRQKLLDGKLYDSNFYMFDKAFLPDGLKDPVVILDGDTTYIADRKFDEVQDGKWVVDIEGTISIRDIIRIPGGKVRVEGGKFAFDCNLEDIKINQKIEMLCIK
ncbi:phage repressor protein [Yersinia enterocolitica]|uniref:phage repressor protein CI n=1 Tax=Yersinia enterocolitica TaxID=630 RepID=UPI000281953B|nr:phage repressor protein CI [Yersinia enterocolitica]AJI83248.1 bacteriophage CI repressor helix-turn-helix domain protein [Yersinia enterocolitica]EKA27290.1 Repressor protein CI [Yersinia enterocolitica subsp. enterocolitica WA-314]KGA71706.1 bacteriophage CI repressor helix-turn-helix domain protein [Yersinia enterocolitica]PNM14140.1 phage repressor protein [Yersinia enterocolitica]CNJ67285.1 CI repressor [Yersinia enterocolitica]